MIRVEPVIWTATASAWSRLSVYLEHHDAGILGEKWRDVRRHLEAGLAPHMPP